MTFQGAAEGAQHIGAGKDVVADAGGCIGGFPFSPPRPARITSFAPFAFNARAVASGMVGIERVRGTDAGDRRAGCGIGFRLRLACLRNLHCPAPRCRRPRRNSWQTSRAP